MGSLLLSDQLKLKEDLVGLTEIHQTNFIYMKKNVLTKIRCKFGILFGVIKKNINIFILPQDISNVRTYIRIAHAFTNKFRSIV